MKLTGKKRNQLIFLALGTALILASLYWLLIKKEHKKLNEISSRIVELSDKVSQAQYRLDLADRFKSELENAYQKLRSIEESMAQGDKYLWFVNMMENFKGDGGVEISNYDQPVTLEGERVPQLPYQTGLFGIRGHARYHDFGAFLAKLENQFPYLKVQNLELEPISVSEATADDEEKLSFKMEVVILVKASTPVP